MISVRKNTSAGAVNRIQTSLCCPVLLSISVCLWSVSLNSFQIFSSTPDALNILSKVLSKVSSKSFFLQTLNIKCYLC
jgi:hypothetical protein